MSWADPIVDEVRRVRQEYAEKFNFDLDAIYRDLKAREAASGRTYADFSTKPLAPQAGPGNQARKPRA